MYNNNYNAPFHGSMEVFCGGWTGEIGRDMVNLTLDECREVIADIATNAYGEWDDAREGNPWAFEATPVDLLRCALQTLRDEIKRLMDLPPVSDDDDDADAELLEKIDMRLAELNNMPA